MVDRPAGFNGHGAAWLDAFDFVYGDCIARYLASSGTGFSCPKRNLSPRDHRWMTNKSHLEQGGATLVDANNARSILQWLFITIVINKLFAFPHMKRIRHSALGTTNLVKGIIRINFQFLFVMDPLKGANCQCK